MQFYVKTYHRQNMKLYISIFWKVTAVFNVVTNTLDGTTCSSFNHDKKAVDQTPLFFEDATQHLLNLGS